MKKKLLAFFLISTYLFGIIITHQIDTRYWLNQYVEEVKSKNLSSYNEKSKILDRKLNRLVFSISWPISWPGYFSCKVVGYGIRKTQNTCDYILDSIESVEIKIKKEEKNEN